MVHLSLIDMQDVAKIQRTEGKVTIKARESIDELLAE